MINKESLILTAHEIEVMNKKLSGAKINQQDSNYLSKYVRPKLKEIKTINAELLLERLEYNQKAIAIENKLKKIILETINNIDAIIIYGSAIQTNYTDYKDIDVLIVLKNKLYKTLKEESVLINEIKKKSGLNLDIRIITKKDLLEQYPHNPSLIYQLKDSKIIYGKIKMPQKIELYNINLKMKLDWTIIEEAPKGIELYKALRNVLLIRLLLNKIIDNTKLQEAINEEIGKKLKERIINNKESSEERKLIKYYLKKLIKDTEEKLEGNLWEKRVELKV